MGRNSGSPHPGPHPGPQLHSLRLPLLPPLPALPEPPFRRLAPRVLLSQHFPSHIVAVRKPSTAWLHLSSARRSRIFHRLFHLPGSFRTSAYRIFCWAFHSGHTLNGWSLVCDGNWHHQHWAVGELSPLASTIRCGSAPLSAGSTLTRASWYFQQPCRPACGFSAYCISSGRSGPRLVVALPPTSFPGSPAWDLRGIVGAAWPVPPHDPSSSAILSPECLALPPQPSPTHPPSSCLCQISIPL